MLLSFNVTVFSQITGYPPTWTTAYCNQEYGLNYKAVSVPLNQRVSSTAGTGSSQPANMAISGIGTNVIIRKAFLWFTIVGQTAPTTSYPSLALKNPSGTTLSLTNLTCVSSINNQATGWLGKPNTNFASGNTYNYRAEVTLVGNIYNGNYTISGLPTTLSTNPDIDVTGAMLMIIYKDNNDCGLGSLYIQDVLVSEATSYAWPYKTTMSNLCFPIPSNTTVQYTHFINLVDVEIDGNIYLGPDAVGGFVNFTPDMYNFISSTSNYVLPDNTIPNDWIIQMPDDNPYAPNDEFGNVRGFYWKDNTINSTITSSFTVPYYNCQGSTITMNGTASTGQINQHKWTIVETNTSGTPLSTATEWLGSWIPGAPGAAETFPTPANGGPTLSCGKYYKIKLALNNGCQVWVETTRNIMIPCNPVLDFRYSTASLCSSKSLPGTGHLSVTGLTGTNYNLKWIVNNPNLTQTIIYNGGLSDIIVHPTATTTYTCVLTDLTTGCSSIGNYTITVYPMLNAAFNNSETAVNSSYFNESAIPVVTNATSIPGFSQNWKVEEIQNGLVVSTVNSSYWPSNPLTTALTFGGYDDYNLNYSGNVTLNTLSPTSGRFLYGHTYKITRSVIADNCPLDESFITLNKVYMPQAPNGDIYDNKNKSSNLNDVVSITPNPSNGKYKLILNDEGINLIEIYDVLGNLIKSIVINNENKEVDIDLVDYKNGIYIAKMMLNGTIIEKKLVKE